MYQLDTHAAKAADQIGGRIDETGKYIGQFIRAEEVQSTQGTKGIEFTFRADDGRTADFISLWTINNKGEQLLGYKQLMAIMACLKVKQIAPRAGEVEKYDTETKQKKKVKANVFPDLMNKPIGLLLQREEYRKRDQSVGHKMAIFAPFDAVTEFTASEILSRAVKPETLGKMVATLRDRPLRDQAAQAPAADAASTSSGGGFGDFSDDIPF